MSVAELLLSRYIGFLAENAQQVIGREQCWQQ
jgi:hypothetical protein